MGKFQKRIEYVDWRDIHSKDCIDKEVAIKVIRLSVVEEAKKEFPSHLMDLAVNSNYKEIQEWFERWFK